MALRQLVEAASFFALTEGFFAPEFLPNQFSQTGCSL